MSFHEIRFPANLSFGSVGGPERRTDIVTLANGYEERNAPWLHARRRFDAGLGLRSLEDVETLVTFFEARRGQLFGFRWKDWTDFRSCPQSQAVSPEDQLIGIGDGVNQLFPLCKRYVSGPADYLRPVRKPVAGTVQVAVAEEVMTEWVDFSVDFAVGVVALAYPPDVGTRVTAGFEFDVPVRFDTDRVAVSVASFYAGDVPSVPVVEVRL